MALTKEETQAMLADLFAMPDAVKGKKPTPKKANAPTTPSTTPKKRAVIDLPGFTPSCIVTEVVQQNCKCCGEVSHHIRARRVRFTAPGKFGEIALEIGTAVPERIPAAVDTIYEDVPICPKCITMSRVIDDLTCLRAQTQLELFYG